MDNHNWPFLNSFVKLFLRSIRWENSFFENSRALTMFWCIAQSSIEAIKGNKDAKSQCHLNTSLFLKFHRNIQWRSLGFDSSWKSVFIRIENNHMCEKTKAKKVQNDEGQNVFSVTSQVRVRNRTLTQFIFCNWNFSCIKNDQDFELSTVIKETY